MKSKARLREAELPQVNKVMHCVVVSIEKYPPGQAEVGLCLFGDELDGVDFTIDVEVIK